MAAARAAALRASAYRKASSIALRSWAEISNRLSASSTAIITCSKSSNYLYPGFTHEQCTPQANRFTFLLYESAYGGIVHTKKNHNQEWTSALGLFILACVCLLADLATVEIVEIQGPGAIKHSNMLACLLL